MSISIYDGKLYGYICMNCGQTIHDGVNKDGECKACVQKRKEESI